MIYLKWLALCLLDWVLLLTVPVAAPTPAALQEQQNIIRLTETGEPVPPDVLAARAIARAQVIK